MAATRLPLSANRGAPASGSAGVENNSTTRSPASVVWRFAPAADDLDTSTFGRRLLSGFKYRGDISSTDVVPSHTSDSNHADARGPRTLGSDATGAPAGTVVRSM